MYRWVAGRLIELALLLWLIWTLFSWGWIVTAVVIGNLIVFISRPVATAFKTEMAARHEAERQRGELLVSHADYEHEMIKRGDLRGVYGVYEPPPMMRGCGIWMAK